MRTLVLDKAYQPIEIVAWHDAVTLWARGADLLETYSGDVVHPGSGFERPSVVRMRTRLRKSHIRFTRDNLYFRDHGECQYCGIAVRPHRWEREHVIPRSQGGRTCWTNIVVACHGCNHDKSNRTPAQAGMRLRRPPVALRVVPLSWRETYPASWRFYLDTGSRTK